MGEWPIVAIHNYISSHPIPPSHSLLSPSKKIQEHHFQKKNRSGENTRFFSFVFFRNEKPPNDQPTSPPRKAIPATVRRDQPMDLPDGELGEAGSLALLKDMLSCSAGVRVKKGMCTGRVDFEVGKIHGNSRMPIVVLFFAGSVQLHFWADGVQHIIGCGTVAHRNDMKWAKRLFSFGFDGKNGGFGSGWVRYSGCLVSSGIENCDEWEARTSWQRISSEWETWPKYAQMRWMLNGVSLPGFSMLPTLMRRRNLIALDCLVNDLCKSVTLVCLKKEPPEFTAV